MTDPNPTQRPKRGFLSARKIEIPKDRYAADLELHDRFVQFSGELMRLAIGGIAAIGFTITILVGKGPLPAQLFRPALAGSVILSMLLFTLAAGTALAHRFLAADGFYHHLRAIKLLIISETRNDHPDLTDDFEKVIEAARVDERVRTRKFALSERCLFASGGLLLAGLAAFVNALIVVLRHP